MPVANYSKADTLNNRVDTGSLYYSLINNSLPVISVNDSLGDIFIVTFSRNITSEESEVVNSLIASHGGDPLEPDAVRYQRVLPQGGQRVADRGFQFNAPAGQTTNFDFQVTEDLFIKEGFAIAYNYNIKDSVSMASVHPPTGPLHYYLKDLPLDVHRGDKTVGIVNASNESITETNFNGLT